MPVSDVYVIQYLLQETMSKGGGVEWEERSRERAGYTAKLGGVRVELENAHFRAGACVMLRFHSGNEEFSICEPMPQGWLGQSYESDDDRTLAARMRELMRAAAQQCGKRRSSAIEHASEIRQRVYQKLLFRDAESELVMMQPGAES